MPFFRNIQFSTPWVIAAKRNRIENHPPIVTEEVFQLVQLEIEARKEFGNRYSGKGPFSNRIVCSDCGGFYGSKVWHSTDQYRRIIWRCNNKYARDHSKEQRCSTPHISEQSLMDCFVCLISEIISDKSRIIDECREIIDTTMDTDDLDRHLAKLQGQALGLKQQIRALIDENASKQLDQDAYQDEYAPMSNRYEALLKKISGIQKEKSDKVTRAKRIELFMRMLEDQRECVDFDSALFSAFVEKVVVSGDKTHVQLNFLLHDGTEHRMKA